MGSFGQEIARLDFWKRVSWEWNWRVAYLQGSQVRPPGQSSSVRISHSKGEHTQERALATASENTTMPPSNSNEALIFHSSAAFFPSCSLSRVSTSPVSSAVTHDHEHNPNREISSSRNDSPRRASQLRLVNRAPRRMFFVDEQKHFRALTRGPSYRSVSSQGRIQSPVSSTSRISLSQRERPPRSRVSLLDPR